MIIAIETTHNTAHLREHLIRLTAARA